MSSSKFRGERRGKNWTRRGIGAIVSGVSDAGMVLAMCGDPDFFTCPLIRHSDEEINVWEVWSKKGYSLQHEIILKIINVRRYFYGFSYEEPLSHLSVRFSLKLTSQNRDNPKDVTIILGGESNDRIETSDE